MLSLWCYPWTLASEGLDPVWMSFDELGVEEVNLASHYHSVRSMQPRHPDDLFVQNPGGCYFDPAPGRFDGTPIDPPVNEVPPFDDPLTTVAESGQTHGIDVNGWVVLTHNSRLGETNPAFRMESAFGDPQDHALCPSHDAVRSYFAAVVEAVADRGVSEVQLESLGYRPVLHGHGARFGHDKRQVLTTRSEELLLSQCFCNGCRRAGADHEVDLSAAQDVVQTLLREAFATPGETLPDLELLLTDHPELDRLFDFRASIIDRLASRLSRAAGETPLNYYVMDGGGFDADDIWPSGVRLDSVTDALDRVTALCYVDSPDAAADRLREIESAVDCPVDAGFTLNPELVPSQQALHDLLGAVGGLEDRRIHLYHYSLMSETHLEWIRRLT